MKKFIIVFTDICSAMQKWQTAKKTISFSIIKEEST